jgi:hypothetical protein
MVLGADRRRVLAESRDIMTIILSNSMVPANSPTGTTIGVLTAKDGVGSIVPCNFILTKRAGGYFSVSGTNLITAWNGSILPGYYSLRVRANGISTRFSSSATFAISVGAVDPAPPTPTGIKFTSAVASLPDNSVAGTTVALVSVSMSDGSTFSGALTANPVGVVAISNTKTMVLARGLSPADDGVQQWGVTAAQNGVTVSSSIAVQVNRVGPAPAPAPAPPPAPQTGTHWNESDTVTGILFSDADFTCSSSMGVVHSHNGTRSNTFKSTGKWYFELHTHDVGGATTGFGIAKTSADLTKEGGDDTNSIVIDIQGTAPQVRYNAGLKGFPVGTPYANVTYAFAVDFDAGLFWGRNLGSGTQYWNGSSSADPATATGGITFAASGANWCMFTTFSNDGDSTTMNAGATVFSGAVPTGFTAWDASTATSAATSTKTTAPASTEAPIASERWNTRRDREQAGDPSREIGE